MVHFMDKNESEQSLHPCQETLLMLCPKNVGPSRHHLTIMDPAREYRAPPPLIRGQCAVIPVQDTKAASDNCNARDSPNARDRADTPPAVHGAKG